jgi:hypothetical protein
MGLHVDRPVSAKSSTGSIYTFEYCKQYRFSQPLCSPNHTIRLNPRAHCESRHLFRISKHHSTSSTDHHLHFVPLPPFPSPLVSVYLPKNSGFTNNTNNLHKNGGTNMPIDTTATFTLIAASLLFPFAASSANMGIKHTSPSPSSTYVGRRLSIPFRVLVAPMRSADVKPPTMMPPKRRAKRIEDGLMCEGCRRRNESTKRVLVIRGMVKRFAMASMTKALRMMEPVWAGSGVIFGLVAGDLDEDGILAVVWFEIQSKKRVVGSLVLFVCLKVDRCMMVVDVIDYWIW